MFKEMEEERKQNQAKIEAFKKRHPKYNMDEIEVLKEELKHAEFNVFNRYSTDGELDFEKILLKTLFKVYKRSKLKHVKTKEESKAVSESWRGVGSLVKIRPCAKEYNKTYLGILLGDIALGFSGEFKDDTLELSHSMHNPAIFVPEIKKIIFGCESWWSKIKNEEELKEITDEDIDNTWYVKLLKENQ